MSCDSVMDSPGVEWNFQRGPLSTVAGILAGTPRNGESSGPLVRDGWPLCPCKAALPAPVLAGKFVLWIPVDFSH